ncbi:LysR substrate-binding domain-containing protein [Limoniibacter endophyticus]|uniref:LysR family transcriptional regulator n=1 Tax=Limoniibacter endophyticus TaxID=1565040 RepID=A0A8J3DR45_9HYPH|nr:LysR substrate-binding domain-containing protein [Limoniibacter endophyticus]GHC75642.1 LysR family transcriptional regulator [Limoniibacter endophyticus]
MDATRLPPMNAMRVFEAVARHLSFTKAGDELAMTQAAVSYQIKVLEERVGYPLFTRHARRIALTPRGEKLAPMVQEAFELLRSAFEAVQEDTESVLSFSIVPTFAAHWLAANIGRFQLAHPNIAVRMDASVTMVDLFGGQHDLAIRAGARPDDERLIVETLLLADFSPMISPALLERSGPVETPADLLKMPLVDPDDPWWHAWFEAVCVPYRPTRQNKGSKLGGQTFEAAATLAGQGVGILTPIFFRQEISEGRLIQPFAQTATRGEGYWLVYPKARANSPKIRMFSRWLLRETEELRS